MSRKNDDDAPCVACRDNAASTGALCAACVEALARPARLCPEQIASRLAEPQRGGGNAWLVDPFGTPHHVSLSPSERACASIVIGRHRDCQLAIADAGVSQIHAELVYSDFSGSWYVIDRESANATRVGDEPVTQGWLEAGDRVGVGDVAFYFVPIEDAELGDYLQRLRRLKKSAAGHATLVNSLHSGRRPRASEGLVLEEADGGGIARIGDIAVQLSVLELELLQMLTDRRRAGRKAGAAAQFVPSRLLTMQLSFETAKPTNQHLKALVRRTRNKFASSGVSEVIESRMGLGYRLLLEPRD